MNAFRMGKLVALTLGLTLGVVFISPVLGQESAPVAVVEAEGVATNHPGNAGLSHDEALEAALRAAVEKASGTFIQTESEMREFQLVRDEVLTRTEGYIRSHTVLSEGPDGDLYRLRVKAEVVREPFLKSMDQSLSTLYRRVGMPSVMVVIHESTAEGPSRLSTPNVSETAIRQTLMQNGFKFIDFRTSGGGPLLARLTPGQELDREAVMDVGRKAGVALVIIGTAQAQEPQPLGNGKIFSALAVVTLDAIRTDTGQAIASANASQTMAHPISSQAALGALKKSTAKALDPLMAQVSYAWVQENNQGKVVEVKVNNISYPRLVELQKRMGAGMSGVRQVRQRSFRQKTALLEVTATATPQKLAEQILAVAPEEWDVEVEETSAQRVTLRLPDVVAPLKPPPPASSLQTPESSDSEESPETR
ncbi:MAG: hypothetical protein OEV94_10640 [Deltaproteobacteria bacterium]|nr:hypothetical protein [Deltaproteobacteria bacterium]